MGEADDDQRRTRGARGINLFREAIHFSHDAIFDQPFHVEIDQQSHFAAGKPQVRHELGTVHAVELLNGFDFDYDRALDEEIDPIPAIERLTS